MKIIKNILLILTLFIFTGCTTATLYNVQSGGLSKKVGVEKMRSAILKASLQRGWKTLEDDKKSHLVLNYSTGKHSATIDVFYDDTKYDIKYKDSINLKYDGNKIHKRYNRWVDFLEKSINKILISTAFSK